MKIFFLFIGVLMLVAFTAPSKKITVWLIGDSTMADKSVRAYPETGWGMPFRYFFDSTVVVENRAQNGRSTRSFLDEGRWTEVRNKMKEGDYVFIQFGHNDEVPTKKTYTTPDEFKNNLRLYIRQTKELKGIPVLLTPVARRKFDSTGGLLNTHPEYSELVQTVARELQVPLIDLDGRSRQLLQQWGPGKSKYLFNHLEPGEHPNYPGGKIDDTHFSELGARMMAQLVLADIRKLLPELEARIVRPPVKN
jgi:lysophospholipase L1-like esterase